MRSLRAEGMVPMRHCRVQGPSRFSPAESVLCRMQNHAGPDMRSLPPGRAPARCFMRKLLATVRIDRPLLPPPSAQPPGNEGQVSNEEDQRREVLKAELRRVVTRCDGMNGV